MEHNYSSENNIQSTCHTIPLLLRNTGVCYRIRKSNLLAKVEGCM